MPAVNKNATFVYYQDPGHGWCRVPKSLLRTLGIANKVSRYSYESGTYAFLEEDCDFTVFVNAWCAATKETINAFFTKHVIEKHTDGQSHIRSYPSYQA